MAAPPPPARSRRWRRRGRKGALGIGVAAGATLLIVAYLAVLAYSQPHVSGDRLSVTAFFRYAQGGRIVNAKILDVDSYVVGQYVRDDRTQGAYSSPYLKETRETLLDLLIQTGVPTDVDQQNLKRTVSLASVLLPALILVLLFVYLVLSYRRGTGLFGVRSGARRMREDDIRVSFADVAGQDAAIAELREVREFLAEPQRFRAVGASMPKGILLFGPPGCGKTLVARALAGEAGASFFSISGSDFVELYVGVGAARVRDLFKEARENVPALIFVDELDSIGRARAQAVAGVGHGEQEHALNQLLAEMDGFSPSEGIIVVGATNRPDILDPALLRPGRFDRSIGLERPDEAARLAILTLHAAGKRLDAGADLGEIAAAAIGLTGADLANLLNEAALLSLRSGRESVTQSDLKATLQRILDAPERQRRLALRERSVGRRFTSEDRVTFGDVAGLDEVVEELSEVRHYLTEPDRFVAMGARPPRGILLSGPPGCGKTLLARAVAGEANAAFVSASASEFVEVFAGEGASRVRDLFAEARAIAPAIVFLDELDAIGGRRGTVGDGHHEREQTLNQILIELDGFQPATGVTVIAATNRPDILDPALVRPGRFDRLVSVSLPDRAGRRAILAVHAQGKPLAGDVDLDALAGLTRGFSGADLANVLNESALLATRRQLASIPMAVVDEAVDRATLGIAASRGLMSDGERRLVAYHECGHLLVALATPGATAPHKVTLLARGETLGHCTMIERHDHVVESRTRLLGLMACLLGGRAAEELVFGEPASTSADDLRRATAIARRMVCDLGMSDAIGPRTIDARAAQDSDHPVEREIGRLIDQAHRHAVDVLKAARERLDRTASALLAAETLSADEIDRVVAETPPPTGATPTGGPPVAAGALPRQRTPER